MYISRILQPFLKTHLLNKNILQSCCLNSKYFNRLVMDQKGHKSILPQKL